jgi:hypothetical protein
VAADAAAIAAAGSTGFTVDAKDDLVGAGGGGSMDAISEFEEKFEEFVVREEKLGTVESQVKLKAMTKLNKRHPELHRQYVEAANANRGNSNTRVLF